LLDRFRRAPAERRDHFLVQDPHVAGRDRAHREFLLPRHAELPHHENIQRRRQGTRDFVTHRYAAPRQREHEEAGPSP